MQLHLAKLWWLAALISSGSVGCVERATAEAIVQDEATMAEKAATRTLYWNVASDGKARLVVRGPDAKVLKSGVAGQLTFGGDKHEDISVELTMDEETGVLEADGPQLHAGVTELKYALLVNGEPRVGVLHLPATGTQGLTAAAGDSGKSTEARGPNGGVLHVVEGKHYELLADAESGITRVYLVGQHAVRPKKLQLALDADPPARVELIWHEDGYYFAELDARRPPRKMSLLVMDQRDRVHVVLVGYRPHTVLVVDSRPGFWVHRGWGRGHYKGTVYGPPGHMKAGGDVHVVSGGKVYIDDPKAKVHFKTDGKGKGNNAHGKKR